MRSNEYRVAIKHTSCFSIEQTHTVQTSDAERKKQITVNNIDRIRQQSTCWLIKSRQVKIYRSFFVQDKTTRTTTPLNCTDPLAVNENQRMAQHSLKPLQRIVHEHQLPYVIAIDCGPASHQPRLQRGDPPLIEQQAAKTTAPPRYALARSLLGTVATVASVGRCRKEGWWMEQGMVGRSCRVL